MARRISPQGYMFSSCFSNAKEVVMTESVHPSAKFCGTTSFLGSVKYVQTASLKNKKVVPDAKPPSTKDVKLLSEFFSRSKKLVVLTGAGISTECGIPDYRSPNGAYSTGFRPIIHQEFIRSSRARRRYWARNYPIWKKFNEAKPGPAHTALASLEKANRISCLITQNIDGLHNRAGSSPVELHGTVHVVACLKCGFSFPWEIFQDELKTLNSKWAAAIESLSNDSKSNKNFGMKRIWGGDIEIDENFWADELHIPTCSKYNGVLKPDVVFFGDNIAEDRAKNSRVAAKSCDAFLVLGSSLTTMFPLELVSMARRVGAATAIINIGYTEADHIADLKINAQVGKILPLVLKTDSLNVPATSD